MLSHQMKNPGRTWKTQSSPAKKPKHSNDGPVSVQLRVTGSNPQFIMLLSDGHEETFPYSFEGKTHSLHLQLGMDKGSSSDDSKLRCVTVRYVPSFAAEERKAVLDAQGYHRRTLKQIATALRNAEKARLVLEHDEASDFDDLIAVALEVKTLTVELNKWRAVDQLQYERHITTLRCAVYASQTHRLVEVPGKPMLLVSEAMSNEVMDVGMTQEVRTETLSTAVPEGVEDEIEGEFHAEIKLNKSPEFVAYHKGLAYVTAGDNVMVCDVADAKVVRTWPLHRGGIGAFGVVVHEQSIYIANNRTKCIQVYGLDGTFQRQIGTFGLGPGKFICPLALAISGADPELYVSDYNGCVQVFGIDGTFKRLIGSSGYGPGQYIFPGGLAVDEECVYVCDNNRVQVFGLDGTFQRTWNTKGTGDGLADIVVHHALLYVSDGGAGSVRVFEKATGAFVRSWGSEGTVPDQFRREARGMALSDDGQLLVCDAGNQCVQVFV